MQGVHGLPKTIMRTCHQLAVLGQLYQWLLLPNCIITLEIRKHFRGQNEKAAINQGSIATRFFREALDLAILDIERSKAAGRIGSSEGGSLAMATVWTCLGKVESFPGLVTVSCRSPISLCHLGFECERADAAQI